VRKLKRALEGAKNIYSPDPVLRPDTIDLQDADAHTILQLANIAQLGAWIMDGSIESIRQGDKYILPMLQDREGGLIRSAIEVWTGIKTHLAMDSLLKKPDELSSEQILRPIFSDSVRQRLAERRSDPQFKEQRAGEITAALKARQDEVQETILPEGGLGRFIQQ
jgi:protein TBF1